MPGEFGAEDKDVPEAAGYEEMKFLRATELVRALPQNYVGPGGLVSVQLQANDKLRIYGLFKQATAGDIQGSRPPFYDYVSRAKWDAWKALKGMDSVDAKRAYVKTFLEIMDRHKDHPHAAACLRSMRELDRRWSAYVHVEGFGEGESPPTPPSAPSAPPDAADNVAYLSGEELNAALAAREAAEEAERASALSEAGNSRFMSPAAFPQTAPGGIPTAVSRMSLATAPSPPYSSCASFTAAPELSAFPPNPMNQPRAGHPYLLPRATPQEAQQRQYQAELAAANAAPPSMAQLARSADSRQPAKSGTLGEEAEIVLQALQAKVAALNERIDMIKRDYDRLENQKRQTKVGLKPMLKLLIRHALINSTLFLVVFAYLCFRRSPIALAILAEMAPKLVQTYNSCREVVALTVRSMVHRGQSFIGTVTGRSPGKK